MLAIFAIIVTVRSAGADRLEISTPLAPSVTAASQGVLFDGYITTSMQFGVDIGTGKLVPGGAGPETVQALRNIGAVFDKAGLSLNSSATACVLFVSELEANFNAASTAYKTFFPDEPHPARSPSGVHFLLEGATVAVQCWGYSGERVKIRPAHFFDEDFNSQGILVPLNLYTAGQVGADPVTGGMVTGEPQTRHAKRWRILQPCSERPSRRTRTRLPASLRTVTSLLRIFRPTGQRSRPSSLGCLPCHRQ